MVRATARLLVLASVLMLSTPPTTARAGSDAVPLWESNYAGGFHYAFAPPGNEISDLEGTMRVGFVYMTCWEQGTSTELGCYTNLRPNSCPEAGELSWHGLTTVSGTWDTNKGGFIPCDSTEEE